MFRGILDIVGLAATLVFALPVGIAGLALLGRGDVPLGVGLVAAAFLMVLVQEYLTTPGDIPELIVSSVAGVLLPNDDD